MYTSHFKCGNTIRHDYPELNRWMKNLYWKNEAFSSTTDFHHIKVGFELYLMMMTSVSSLAGADGVLPNSGVACADPLLLEPPADQPDPDRPSGTHAGH